MRRVRALFAVPLALLSGLLGALSCGPSVQSIYEGDVRFEHCYRLDLELEVATSHRQACWTSWLNRYTYGQSRDKLEYARRRVRSFPSGDGDRPSLNVGAAKTEESRQFYLVVPAPTSVHASPPPIATRVNAMTEAPPSTEAAPERATPGEDCEGACRGAFASCREACNSNAKGSACASCDPDYKKCMQRCFE
jgi:hypothetical protein